MPPSSSSHEKLPFLEEDERDEGGPSEHGRTRRNTHHNAAILWVILLLLLAFIPILLLILYTKTLHSPPSPHHTPYNGTLFRPHGCGATPSSAASQNCTFDIMNFGFTPNECHYPSLAAASLPNPPLAWWAHRSNTTTPPALSGPLAQSADVLANLTGIWTEHTYHVVHCIYGFKVLHHAALLQQQGGEGLVPAGFASWGHTLHCEEVLGDRRWDRNSRQISAQIFSLETRCVRLGEAVEYGGD